jgi:hypothetical protein
VIRAYFRALLFRFLNWWHLQAAIAHYMRLQAMGAAPREPTAQDIINLQASEPALRGLDPAAFAAQVTREIKERAESSGYSP